MARSRTFEDLRLPRERDGWVRLYETRHLRNRRMHRHAELEFNLVVAGRATYLIDERRYDLSPGTSLWLFPGQDHLLIDESPDHAMWIGVFSPRMLRQVCTTAGTRELRRSLPISRFARTLDAEACRRVAGLCRDVSRCAPDVARSNAGLAYLALAAWDVHQQAEAFDSRSDVHPAVERAARLMRDETEPLAMAELARRAGLSESQLSRLFHRQTGVTLVRYRTLQRLERFEALYGQGRRRNLIEAALAAGFGSYAQFHRAFKQAHGYGPREHRRRVNAASP